MTPQKERVACRVEIFEQSDVAEILGFQKNRVKNWTSGRPFNLQPSVRNSLGKGSRKLFSREDVYCFMLIKEMNDIGIPVPVVREFVETRRDLAFADFWSDPTWIGAKAEGPKFSWETNLTAECQVGLHLDPEQQSASYLAVNVKRIVDEIDGNIDTLRGRRIRGSDEGGKPANSTLTRSRASGTKSKG